MSMHLVGPYMTTTKYNRRKSKKPTQTQLQKLEVEWRQHNKRMRQMNCHSAQFDDFDDYVAYTRGEYKPQKSAEDCKFKPLKIVEPYRRETPNIPSKNDIGGTAARKEPQQYTGDYIIGIATTHKSNLMPVTSKKQAVEASTMRRN